MWERYGESIIAGLLLVVAAWLFATAKSYPQYPGLVSQPGDWPAMLAALMAIASAGLVVQVSLAHRRRGRQAPSQQPSQGDEVGSEAPGDEPSGNTSSSETTDRAEGNLFLLAASLVLLFAYVWILPILGFWLATPVFLALYMMLLGLRKPFHLGVLTLGMTAILILIFAHGVLLPLPRGIGFLRECSFLFH